MPDTCAAAMSSCPTLQRNRKSCVCSRLDKLSRTLRWLALHPSQHEPVTGRSQGNDHDSQEMLSTSPLTLRHAVGHLVALAVDELLQLRRRRLDADADDHQAAIRKLALDLRQVREHLAAWATPAQHVLTHAFRLWRGCHRAMTGMSSPVDEQAPAMHQPCIPWIARCTAGVRVRESTRADILHSSPRRPQLNHSRMVRHWHRRRLAAQPSELVCAHSMHSMV